MADNLYAIGVDVPFLSVLTPFKGTPLYEQMAGDGRMLPERGWEFYNGYNVTFRPRAMTPDALLTAHRRLWRRAFSLPHALGRAWRGVRRLRAGALLMSLCMNGFYALKALRGNLPADMRGREEYSDFEKPRHGAALPFSGGVNADELQSAGHSIREAATTF